MDEKGKILLTYLLTLMLVFVLIFFGCGKRAVSSVNTIEGSLKTYYEMADGTWQVDGNTYQYRLEISGRMAAAVKDTTYVYLSNIENISFQKAMMASGLGSNMEDYFAIEEAVLVEMY